MASAESSLPTCPVCNQADQVKTMQAAYATGVARTAPPDMPTKNVSMFKYITACVFLVGICVFLIVTLIGGLENNLPQIVQLILAVVTLVCIVTALVVSYYAFQRVVTGDNETTLLLPAWDRATAKWRSMYYCTRDSVVFDPATNKVVSDEELDSIRASATKQIAETAEDPTLARP
ncbi:MAG: hypothetical protein NVS2B12_03020 [Ktedonobacteraceae bacterium]